MKEVYRSYEDLPIIMNATQLSSTLGISKTQTYVLLHSSSFPTIKIGRRLVVTKQGLIDWLERQTQ